MQTISINFIVPQGRHELSCKQLRYVYQLIAGSLDTDDKSCHRESSTGLAWTMPSAADFAGKESKPYVCSVGAAQRLSVGRTAGLTLSKKGISFFEVASLALAELNARGREYQEPNNTPRTRRVRTVFFAMRPF